MTVLSKTADIIKYYGVTHKKIYIYMYLYNLKVTELGYNHAKFHRSSLSGSRINGWERGQYEHPRGEKGHKRACGE